MHALHATEHLGLPPQQSERVFAKLELALSIPATLLDTNILHTFSVDHVNVVTSDSVHFDLVGLQARDVNLKVQLLVDIGNSKVDETIVAERGAAVQVGRLDGVADPAGVRAAGVFWGTNIERNGMAAHVL